MHRRCTSCVANLFFFRSFDKCCVFLFVPPNAPAQIFFCIQRLLSLFFSIKMCVFLFRHALHGGVLPRCVCAFSFLDFFFVFTSLSFPTPHDTFFFFFFFFSFFFGLCFFLFVFLISRVWSYDTTCMCAHMNQKKKEFPILKNVVRSVQKMWGCVALFFFAVFFFTFVCPCLSWLLFFSF